MSAHTTLRSIPWPEPRPGTYALLLTSTRYCRLQIGRRGEMDVVPGYYVYIGSAFGSGGLRARLMHHSRVAARPHWHVDYLRALTQLTEIWYTYDPVRREHQWARSSGCLPDAAVPLVGFGTSDCQCHTHLYAFPHFPSWDSFWHLLVQAVPEHASLHRLHLATRPPSEAGMALAPQGDCC